jgi:hypothetical protein
MADDLTGELVARLKVLHPEYADIPDDVLAASIFHTSNARDAGGAPSVAEALSPWTKAATIGAPGLGERYTRAGLGEILASANPLKLLAEYAPTGQGRLRSVANADPTGIQAFHEGKGPMPIFMGTIEDVGPSVGAAVEAPGIRAFHASPYEFSRFDSSKIGTGEGAQAYGHGLYYAEAEPVMEDYYRGFTEKARRTQPTEHGGVSYPGGTMRARTLQRLADEGRDKTIADLESSIRFNESYAPEMANLYRNELEFVRAADPAAIKLPTAHRYEVNIKADPAQFLDWDKPLSEQTPHVQEALKTLGIEAPSKIERDMAEGRLKLAWQRWEDALKAGDTAAAARAERAIKVTESDFRAMNNPMTGRDVYQSVVENAPTSYADRGPAIASQSLKDAGIPGIKYLDQGSRRGGSGTYNYVVHDDQLIDILRKYGLLAPLAGASVGQLLNAAPDRAE